MGLILVSLLQGHAVFQGSRPLLVAGEKEVARAPFDPIYGFVRHYTRFFSHFFSPPPICSGGNTVNDFQVEECAEFSKRTWLLGALAALPFALVAFYLLWALDSVRLAYRRATRILNEKRATGLGMVTAPARAPGDRFSKYYGLRPVAVQLKDGKQIKVYMPLEQSLPEPGQKLAYFEWGTYFGEMRHFAVLHAPHMAIVRGVR